MSRPPNTVLSTLLQPSKQTNQIDRIIGTTATLGLSVALLKLALKAYNYCDNNQSSSVLEESDKSNENSNNYERKNNKNSNLLSFVVQFVLNHIMLILPSNQDEKGDAYYKAAYRRKNSQSPKFKKSTKAVWHHGSCHCGSILFVIKKATSELVAKDSPGKIRFPHILVNASTSFKFTKGTKYLSMYYVVMDENAVNDIPVMAAHAFCIRCGVPILRAPDRNKDNVEVNINCLDGNISENVKVIYCDEELFSLSDGNPLADQWNREEVKTKEAQTPTVLKATNPFDLNNSIFSSPSTEPMSTTIGSSLDLDSIAGEESIESSSTSGLSISNSLIRSSGIYTANNPQRRKPADIDAAKGQFDTYLKRHLHTSSSSSLNVETSKGLHGSTPPLQVPSLPNSNVSNP